METITTKVDGFDVTKSHGCPICYEVLKDNRECERCNKVVQFLSVPKEEDVNEKTNKALTKVFEAVLLEAYGNNSITWKRKFLLKFNRERVGDLTVGEISEAIRFCVGVSNNRRRALEDMKQIDNLLQEKSNLTEGDLLEDHDKMFNRIRERINNESN